MVMMAPSPWTKPRRPFSIALQLRRQGGMFALLAAVARTAGFRLDCANCKRGRRQMTYPTFLPSALSLVDASQDGGSAGIVAEDFMIPSGDPGIELFVRNKHPADRAHLSADKILLYVHGTSQAAETTFDLALDGLSWMDYLAKQGWDVYLVDLRGYGRSTRPPEMRAPAADNPPIVTTDVALQDFGTAVEFVLKRRNARRLSIIGWSWGTVIVASFAARHRD